MDGADQVGVTLSIFERLTDRSPSESARNQWASIGELEASVMQHLSTFLNVRRVDHPGDEAFPETSASVAAYGILDFSSFSLANPGDRDKLRRSIERAIRLFEPRLSRVAVTIAEPEAQDPVLRFRIDAILRADPVAEPIAFTALLAKDSGRFHVVEARD